MVKRPRALRRWLIITALVIALGVGFGLLRNNRSASLERTLVESLSLGDFSRQVSGTGVVKAALERNIAFKTSGVVESIMVNKGDTVKAGDILAKLDTSAIQRDLSSAKVNLEAAKADVEKLRVQQQVDRLDSQSSLASAQDSLLNAQQGLAEAQKSLNTTERLYAVGAASQNELSTAQESLATSERRLNQLAIAFASAQSRLNALDQLAAAQRASIEAQISQLETTIANLETRLEEAVLIAPFAATVTSISFEPGDQISTGASLRLVDTKDLFVNASFDENRAAELSSGQTASIVANANAELSLAATVRRVSSVANRNNNAAQLEVELDFLDKDLSLGEAVKPGYSVTVRITINELKNTLLIPLEAITEQDGESFVYKVNESKPGQGTVERVYIDILDRNATLAAVKTEGLGPKDKIALINLEALEPGKQVTYDPLEPGL